MFSSTPSSVSTTPFRLPPPSSYDSAYASYKNQWEKRRIALVDSVILPQTGSHVEITCLEWCSSNGSLGSDYGGRKDRCFLLGTTSTGYVVVWEFPTKSSNGQYDEATAEIANNTKPIVDVQVSKNALTGIKSFPKSNDDLTLIITGHDGILSTTFKDLFQRDECLSTTTAKNRCHYDWWEIDRVGPIDQATIYLDHLFSVSSRGDAYKFDIENKKCVSTYRNPSSSNSQSSEPGHEHSTLGLASPESNTTGNSPLLLIGTSNFGKVLIWDVAKDQGMDSLDVGEAIASSNPRGNKVTKKSGFYGRSSSPTPPSSQYNSQPSITSMDISEHWWTFAGGHKCQGPYQSLDGGFLATFHGPSRSLVACTNTRECIQQITSLSTVSGTKTVAEGGKNTPSSTTTRDSRLVSVANEGVVSYWDSTYSLQRTHRVWSGPPSSKAIAVLPSSWISGPADIPSSSNTVAVGGVGPTVDVLQDFCKTQTLTF